MQQHVKILKVYLLATASVQIAEIQKVSKEKFFFIVLKNVPSVSSATAFLGIATELLQQFF